ncbi:MAG: DUF1156 domain-containing protein [Deltaproteobacteria bacterium]|nr:DUF1156 domain-containing protein [Deltaproteobacteria bacterium]
MAIVAEGPRGRVYVPPMTEHEAVARQAEPSWKPQAKLPGNTRWFSPPVFGLSQYSQLFTPRQLVALTTFSDLVMEMRDRVREDAIASGMPDDAKGIIDGGTGATAYADAVATYLGMTVSRLSNRTSTICFWDMGRENIQQVFARQAIPMTWDFVEANPFSRSTGNWLGQLIFPAENIESVPASGNSGGVFQFNAADRSFNGPPFMFSTDPPYYDNIGYADLSDFFYVWLRRSLGKIYPDLFSTMLVPKTEELVATPYRFDGDRNKAKAFFEKGLRRAFERMRTSAHNDYPLAVYYAFKQAESDTKLKDGNGKQALSSTGWETMLEGLLASGFQITGTWPMRTELITNLKKKVSALASSIVLACRPRPDDAPMTTRRDFINALKRELPPALKTLQEGNIAPVDLAQSAIGPGMAIFSRYSKVLEADGTPMRVRAALALINQVLDEYLSEQEGEYDADTRWALAWFEQYGMGEGPYGVAETLSKAKNTAVDGLVTAGILVSRAGKVRLLRRDELPVTWDPASEKRLTVWEVTQHLIRALVDTGSEQAASDLLRKVGGLGDTAKELTYRLYTICDRKKWAQEAIAYNSLVVAWPELVKLAGRGKSKIETQTEMFENQ